MEVVGEAKSGQEAVALYMSFMPDVLLLDIQMPGFDGLDALERLRDVVPSARIVMLTSFLGDGRITRAMDAGASGYLLKSSTRAAIVSAIRDAFAGRRALSPEVVAQIEAGHSAERLHPREITVLALAAEGEGNREIAARLGLSTDTVKTRLKSAFAKLGARDRAHAVRIAIERGYM
jgi:DNA-binding NarL/FixJ family response regulator